MLVGANKFSCQKKKETLLGIYWKGSTIRDRNQEYSSIKTPIATNLKVRKPFVQVACAALDYSPAGQTTFV